ncbi:G patch domain and ankyrin repeat-containing protein 1 homolog [Dioscorea cayenensis subsp. rotundata]|uniref:G patch domain and ankyrin repeat-containing protein 1 homolog n=1 Tax=Dioscorea cayennensis subsp. rotundata TaxID=55577 RepID=A0AB40B0N8_DIOCR|nr:G patch domain and ankyrin repeat-containing protein 1 homolog [Dioscorea cayenensis subsp. rotundata]
MASMGDEGSSSRAIDSTNIGFQLLKKCGWKEGTGLGVSQQGRLEPLETHVKKNKRGLGAEKIKKKKEELPVDPPSEVDSEDNKLQSKKKVKANSKRIRKMLEEDKRAKEKEFERAFFREFWPDNV